MTAKVSAENLLKEIEAAFPLEPLPIKIARSYAGGDEGHEVDALFTGRKWNTIRLKDVLNKFSDYVPFAMVWLTQEAFNYYYPFYLQLSTKQIWQQKDKYLVTEIMLFHLNKADNAYMFERFTPFPDNQKKVIAKYLSFLTQYPSYEKEAQAALDSYWYQFLPEGKPVPPSPVPK